jgi:hypothetical protein
MPMKLRIWAGASILAIAIALGLDDAPPVAQAQDTSSPATLNVEGVLEEGDARIPMDNSLYDEYTFEGRAGQNVVITLSSNDFNPYLIVFSPNGELLGQVDDISEDNLTAQLVVTLPLDGIYIVLANAFDDTGRGQYTLTVTTEDTGVPTGELEATVDVES